MSTSAFGAERLADFVERDARHSEIGEERLVALHRLAEGARERHVIGMDLDRTGNEDEVRAESRGAARASSSAASLPEGRGRESARNSSSAAVAEESEPASRLLFPRGGVAALSAPSVATTTRTARSSRRCCATRPPQPITSSSGWGASTSSRSPRSSAGSYGIASASINTGLV